MKDEAQQQPSEPDPRARIREAALEQFAAHGFRGASVRGIASAAGVSPGLVQHHFASKEKLRGACDAYLVDVIREAREGISSHGAGDPAFIGHTHRKVGLLVRYLTRALLDGDSSITSRWFDETVAEYRAAFADENLVPPIPPEEDPEAVIALYASMQLGLSVFVGELCRHLEVDLDDPAAVARLGRARLYLTANRIVTEQAEREARLGMEAYERQSSDPDGGFVPPSGPGPSGPGQPHGSEPEQGGCDDQRDE